MKKKYDSRKYKKSMYSHRDHKRIDLIELDGYYLFTYVNDWFFKAHANSKNCGKTYKDIIKSKESNEKLETHITAKDFIENWNCENPFDQLLLALLAYNKENKSTLMMDVGCLYGLESLKYARFCRGINMEVTHIAIDPGLGGELAKFNFENNGYDDIKFFPYAASDFDGYVQLNYEIGNNENNRIINPQYTERSFSKVVRSVALDTLINQIGDYENIFIKIDTQGAEHEVFNGLNETLRNKNVVGIFEFFPDGLVSRAQPHLLLESLIDNFILYDVGARRDRVVRIMPGEEKNIVEKARSGNFTWTDIAFIPKQREYIDILEKLLRKEVLF